MTRATLLALLEIALRTSAMAALAIFALPLAACTEGKVEPKTIQYTTAISDNFPLKPGAIGWDLGSITPQASHEVAIDGAFMLPNKDGSAYDILTVRFEFGCDARRYFRLGAGDHSNEAGQVVKTDPPSQEEDVLQEGPLAEMRAVACSGKKNAAGPTVQAASLKQWALDQVKNPTRGLTDQQAAPAAGS